MEHLLGFNLNEESRDVGTCVCAVGWDGMCAITMMMLTVIWRERQEAAVHLKSMPRTWGPAPPRPWAVLAWSSRGSPSPSTRHEERNVLDPGRCQAELR